MPTDITADLERVEELVQQAIRKSRQRQAETIKEHGAGPPDVAVAQCRPRPQATGRIDRRLFQPDDAGRVATHIPFTYVCGVCECNLKGERIKLVEYRAGRNLIFYTNEGHVLHYRGHVLLRVDCDEPIIARSVP